MKHLAIALSLSALIYTANAFAAMDVEEARYPNAELEIPQVVARYQVFVSDLHSKYRQHSDELKITQMVANQGLRLWQQAVRDVQSGYIDDRALYWNRLAMRRLIKQQNPSFKLAPWQRDILIKSAESASRGFSNIHFDDDAHIKILLTGFDPFFLDKDIKQSNPSGVTALALDGYRFTLNGKKVQIETVMLPVRFADFDNGIVESLLTPLYRDNRIDMLLTVSMGRKDFDLERFPGRNRSSQASDNLNVVTGASKQTPLAPMFNKKPLYGPEFVEFSLPVKAMQAAKGNWAINDNHHVISKDKGPFVAKSLWQLQNEVSVEGSGGGYLSNEVSYRAILLQKQLNSSIPVGHIHTPRVQGHDSEVENDIVEQIVNMITLAASTPQFN